MPIVLETHQYGKAETRRVQRDAARHEIRDLKVSTSLRGHVTQAHLYGDQSQVLATDTQKSSAFVYAKSKGIASIEEFGFEHDHTWTRSGPKIRTAAPNKHHFEVDLSPFGLENKGEVFHAADRPYGLTHATVTRDDAPDAGNAWVPGAGLA